MTEKTLQAKIVKTIKEAEARGQKCFVLKQQASIYTPAGISDLLCYCRGILFFIEVKSPERYKVGQAEKGLSEIQKAQIKRFEKIGVKTYVISQWEEFKELWNCINIKKI